MPAVASMGTVVFPVNSTISVVTLGCGLESVILDATVGVSVQLEQNRSCLQAFSQLSIVLLVTVICEMYFTLASWLACIGWV